MAIASSSITESNATDTRHHSNMDKNDYNNHLPIGYRSASVGSVMMVGEDGDYVWEQMTVLPPCSDYKDSSAAAPASPSNGDVYLLDDSTTVLTITSIAWQSGTTVRYTFSGSPDLSGYSTANNVGYIYGNGISNSQHLGRFVLTAVDNTSKYIEISNPLVTSAALDESGLSNSSAELPHSDWDGASNGDYVRYNSTDSLWYRIVPNTGAKCYDSTLGQTRTFNGAKWLGDYRVVAIACSDETTALTTGTAKATYRNVGKMYLTNVRASLTGAGSTSGTTTIDINESGTSVLSTKLTIDATELTSTTAATAHVISDDIIADDAQITIDIDAVSGGADETGLKVYLIGYYI